MAKQRYTLVTHIFSGPRFEDHGIDLDVLPELAAYRNLLVETAKEVWRQKNKDRRRLPNNFEASVSLRMYEISPGSASVPLSREIEVGDQALVWPREPDELDEAVRLLAEAIKASHEDRSLPGGFPKSVLPLFEHYGATLREDEVILLDLPQGGQRATYSVRERARLIKLAEADYEDVVEIEGEIRAADLDKANFVVRLADGSKVSGKLSPEQEGMILDALHEHRNCGLRIKGRGEFSARGELKRVIAVEVMTVQAAGAKEFDATRRPIWEVAAEIGACIPDDAIRAIPNDLARNLDHYLYGAPKDPE